MKYSPEVVDLFEDAKHWPLAQAFRNLVAKGVIGYRVEDDGAGGFRLRYFLLDPHATELDPGAADIKDVSAPDHDAE